MLRNNVCHPMFFLVSFILYVLANIFSTNLVFELILLIIILIFLLKTDISFQTYFYLILPLFLLCPLFYFYPNIVIKIVNIFLYFLFFIYHQNDVSLFYINHKIPFLNERKTLILTRKIYSITKVFKYADIILKTYKKRANRKNINPILFYKYIKNKINNEENCIITMYEQEIYLQKIKQGNLFEFCLFDIIFFLFHGIIMLITIGDIL